MTRIIAGSAQRVVLKVPASGTRPTSDKVREAIFNTLQARGALEQARVLDLYAGSGALGLEALSRGVASVQLVDLSNRAVAVAQKNLKTVLDARQRSQNPNRHRNADRKPGGLDRNGQTGLTVATQVVKQDVLTYLNQYYQLDVQPSEGEGGEQPKIYPGWHLVFLDPPYELPTEQLQTVLERLHPLLDPDAWVVIERSIRTTPPQAAADKWEVVATKTYGETWVGYWRPAVSSPPPAPPV